MCKEFKEGDVRESGAVEKGSLRRWHSIGHLNDRRCHYVVTGLRTKCSGRKSQLEQRPRVTESGTKATPVWSDMNWERAER